MKSMEFEELCRDASFVLGIDDTQALGQGFTVPCDDVLFEASFRDGSDRFTLLAELGPVAPDKKLEVYESLLTLQLLGWAQPGMRFGFNTPRQTTMLCLETGLGQGVSGAWLAGIIRSTAKEVATWRKTLLPGMACLPEEQS
ncbi:MAG: hypothetical protein H7238_12435 [Polaromonas sp.]|nr:hypothetical protein [Polaromonas sp.]